MPSQGRTPPTSLHLQASAAPAEAQLLQHRAKRRGINKDLSTYSDKQHAPMRQISANGLGALLKGSEQQFHSEGFAAAGASAAMLIPGHAPRQALQQSGILSQLQLPSIVAVSAAAAATTAASSSGQAPPQPEHSLGYHSHGQQLLLSQLRLPRVIMAGPVPAAAGIPALLQPVFQLDNASQRQVQQVQRQQQQQVQQQHVLFDQQPSDMDPAASSSAGSLRPTFVNPAHVQQQQLLSQPSGDVAAVWQSFFPPPQQPVPTPAGGPGLSSMLQPVLDKAAEPGLGRGPGQYPVIGLALNPALPAALNPRQPGSAAVDAAPCSVVAAGSQQPQAADTGATLGLPESQTEGDTYSVTAADLEAAAEVAAAAAAAQHAALSAAAAAAAAGIAAGTAAAPGVMKASAAAGDLGCAWQQQQDEEGEDWLLFVLGENSCCGGNAYPAAHPRAELQLQQQPKRQRLTGTQQAAAAAAVVTAAAIWESPSLQQQQQQQQPQQTCSGQQDFQLQQQQQQQQHVPGHKQEPQQTPQPGVAGDSEPESAGASMAQLQEHTLHMKSLLQHHQHQQQQQQAAYGSGLAHPTAAKMDLGDELLLLQSVHQEGRLLQPAAVALLDALLADVLTAPSSSSLRPQQHSMLQKLHAMVQQHWQEQWQRQQQQQHSQQQSDRGLQLISRHLQQLLQLLSPSGWPSPAAAPLLPPPLPLGALSQRLRLSSKQQQQQQGQGQLGPEDQCLPVALTLPGLTDLTPPAAFSAPQLNGVTLPGPGSVIMSMLRSGWSGSRASSQATAAVAAGGGGDGPAASGGWGSSSGGGGGRSGGGTNGRNSSRPLTGRRAGYDGGSAAVAGGGAPAAAAVEDGGADDDSSAVDPEQAAERYVGVYSVRKGGRSRKAQISLGQLAYLATFNSAKEAAQKYNEAARFKDPSKPARELNAVTPLFPPDYAPGELHGITSTTRDIFLSWADTHNFGPVEHREEGSGKYTLIRQLPNTALPT